MGKLILFLADGTTLDIPLERERMRIGRRPGTDLCLPYAAVSGEHAIVVKNASGTTIEDLGSTNGTLVNGVAIARHVLADGDRIDIGRQLLVYLADASAVVPFAARRREHANRVAAQGSGSPSFRQAAGVADTMRLDLPGSAGARAVARKFERSSPADPTPAAEDSAPTPSIAVLSGPSAGRQLRLTKSESLVGRVGTQVAAIRRGADGYRLLAVEGRAPPCVNGSAVTPEGAVLRVGDEIEVAAAKLRFGIAEDRS